MEINPQHRPTALEALLILNNINMNMNDLSEMPFIKIEKEEEEEKVMCKEEEKDKQPLIKLDFRQKVKD